MLTVRQVNMIRLIMEHREGITGQKLSEKLKVSSKTIRNDLVQMNDWFSHYHCRISASKKIGYYITDSDLHKVKECLDLLEAANNQKQAQSPMERKYYIMGKVLGRTGISLYELAERLYVSEQTIYRDVMALQMFLKKSYHFNGLKVENNRLELCAEESCIRSTVYRIIQTQVSSSNTLMDLDFYQFVKEIENLDEIHNFVSYISRYCDAREVIISDQVLFISAWSLFYTNVRIGEGHLLAQTELFQKEDELSRFLVEISETWFLDFKESDLFQLYAFLEALGFLSEKAGVAGNDAAFICTELIARTKEMYGVDFGTMPALADHLKRHLECAIRRVLLDYQLTNPFKEQVKKKYAFSYQIALLFVQILYDVYQKYPTEDEVSFFAVYIQTCLEMQSVTLNVHLVYGTTLGYVYLIESWLKREFGSRIHICGFCPSYKLAKVCDSYQIHMVVSTVPLDDGVLVPHMVISQLPVEQDRVNIDQMLTTLASKDQGDNQFYELFQERRIVFFEQQETFETMIDTCAGRLQDSGCISDAAAFSKETLLRESVYPTLIDHGCYLPHPLLNQAVHNGISVGIVRHNQEKEFEITVVFVMALEPRIHKNFQKIYDFIQKIGDSPLMVRDLQRLEDEAEAVTYLQNLMKLI